MFEKLENHFFVYALLTEGLKMIAKLKMTLQSQNKEENSHINREYRIKGYLEMNNTVIHFSDIAYVCIYQHWNKV